MEQQILLPIFSKSTMLEAWFKRAIMAHYEINLILSTANGRELNSSLEEVFFSLVLFIFRFKSESV